MPFNWDILNSIGSSLAVIGLPAVDYLKTDELSWLVLSIAAGVSVVVAAFALGENRFFSFLALIAAFLVSTFLLTSTDNIILLYVLWELTTIVTWGIGKIVLRSYNTALGPLPVNWLGGIGSVSMLATMLVLIVQSGTLSLGEMQTSTPALVAIALLVAVLAKSSSLVAIAWFPGRERQYAASNALLATAGLVAVGLYPYLRVTGTILRKDHDWQNATLWTALSVALLFALAALKERDLYRIASYVALCQFSLLLSSFTMGNPTSFAGALLTTMTYALGTAALFLVIGLVNQTTANRRLGQVRALTSAQPSLAVLFFLCALSSAGLPPIASFAGKALTSAGLIQFEGSHPYAVLWIGVWIAVAASLLRAFQLTFVHLSSAEIRQPPIVHLSLLAQTPIGLVLGILLAMAFGIQDILAWLEPVIRLLSG